MNPDDSPKRFLFLQGPHSCFFARLADRLEARGHECYRINLRLADWIYWRRRGAVNYRGSLGKWSEYLSLFYDRLGITDIVLLGEQRSYHKVAVELARLRGIRVTVTDWGYLRPDWITLERDGMSGNTSFTKDPDRILELGRQLEEPDLEPRYSEPLGRLAFQNVSGDILSSLFLPFYPGYRSYLPNNPILGYISTGIRMARSHRRAAETRKFVDSVLKEVPNHPFFVFPMQMEGDFQIRAYSRYSDLYVAVEQIIASFARHAPRECRLLIKLHPWDTGLRPWGRISRRLARRFGAANRVLFMDGGSFEELTAHCRGVVTINSTTGVTALKVGAPVITLGSCLYDIPGLTFQGKLDDFWVKSAPPDPELRDAFIKAIAGCIQIKGGFFSEEGLAAVLDQAAERLSGNRVNTASFLLPSRSDGSSRRGEQ